MKGQLNINYEMAWIRLREGIKNGSISDEEGIIHASDLLRVMDNLALDERD